MTTRRAVSYGGLFCLLAAWLASAASTLQDQPPDNDQLRGVESPATDALVNEVQGQAARLRRRLASAPVPELPTRNPFLFDSRIVSTPRPAVRQPEPQPMAPLPPSEPALYLLGVAENQSPDGLKRTAILGDQADAVIMAAVGETVLDRYRVEAIGADAIELKDVATGAIRRLALR
jgi:hypothetical protein